MRLDVPGEQFLGLLFKNGRAKHQVHDDQPALKDKHQSILSARKVPTTPRKTHAESHKLMPLLDRNMIWLEGFYIVHDRKPVESFVSSAFSEARRSEKERILPRIHVQNVQDGM